VEKAAFKKKEERKEMQKKRARFPIGIVKYRKRNKKSGSVCQRIGEGDQWKGHSIGGKRWVKRHVIHNRGSKDVGSQSSTGKIGQPWFSKVSASG